MNNRTRLCVAAVGVLVAGVYLPGLHGPFLFDDFPNFVHHPLAAIAGLDLESLRNAALSNDSGPTGRPLAALSFSLNYWFAGQRFDPFWFKLTNLCIHLVNTLLVYLLARRLMPDLLRGSRLENSSPMLALLVAAAWALHPVQLSSVLYVVQRMASLAALCTLAGLLLYLAGRDRLAARRPGGAALAVGGLLGGVALGSGFKETAFLLPLYAGVVEYLVLDRDALSPRARRLVHALFVALVAFPALALLAAWVARPGLLTGGFDRRPFTLYERLLTEGRVLFDYVGVLLAPRPGAFGLFHDDVVVSRGLLAPPTTVAALCGWLLLGAAAVWSRLRGHRLPCFALGWFLAGHALESTVFPLELKHEHRNYLPSLGVLAGALLVAALAADRIAAARPHVPLLVAALALAPASLTLARAATWGDVDALVASMLLHQPDSPRTRMLAAQQAYGRGALGEAYEHSRVAARGGGDDVAALLNMLRLLNLAAVGADDGSGLQPPPQVYDAALVRETRYLNDLRTLLEAETGRRLLHGRVPAASQQALSQLRMCVAAGAPDCLPLVAVSLEWFAGLYRRTDLPPQVRSMMAADHGRVLVALGRDRDALGWLRRAWEAADDDLQVLALVTLVQLRLGDLDAATASVEQLSSLRGRVGFDSRQLQVLREAVAHARSGGASRPAPTSPAGGASA